MGQSTRMPGSLRLPSENYAAESAAGISITLVVSLKALVQRILNVMLCIDRARYGTTYVIAIPQNSRFEL